MFHYSMAVLLFLGTLGLGQNPIQQKPSLLERLAKEQSPKEMVRAYVAALLRGESQVIDDVYDLSSEGGKAAALVAKTLARTIAGTRTLARVTQQKYGAKGIHLVESILAIRLHYNDDKRIRELVNGVKIYIGEEKGTAIARVPLFEYVPLERKHGRWFFSPDIKGAPAMQAPPFRLGNAEREAMRD